MEKILEVKLVSNDTNENKDQSIPRTLKLKCLTHKELVQSLRTEFKENFLDNDQIKTYWMNDENKLIIFDDDEQLKRVVKENLPIYVKNISIDWPEHFYI